jgi:hypothetical protein
MEDITRNFFTLLESDDFANKKIALEISYWLFPELDFESKKTFATSFLNNFSITDLLGHPHKQLILNHVESIIPFTNRCYHSLVIDDIQHLTSIKTFAINLMFKHQIEFVKNLKNPDLVEKVNVIYSNYINSNNQNNLSFDKFKNLKTIEFGHNCRFNKDVITSLNFSKTVANISTYNYYNFPNNFYDLFPKLKFLQIEMCQLIDLHDCFLRYKKGQLTINSWLRYNDFEEKAKMEEIKRKFKNIQFIRNE